MQRFTAAARAASATAGELGYDWQFYLPRLPFMRDQFPGVLPLWDTWVKGFVGRFGWLDVGFPQMIAKLALAIYVALVGLAAAALWRGRALLRSRWAELGTYVLMALGLLAAIHHAGYRGRADTGVPFEQARYLLPLLPLYGAIVALAVRGAGRRWGHALAVTIVVLALAHGLFAQLLVISRFYG